VLKINLPDCGLLAPGLVQVATKTSLPPFYPFDHSPLPSKPRRGTRRSPSYERRNINSWLVVQTAVKYLLAGGAAGAGEQVLSLRPSLSNRSDPSFRERARHLRPTEDILDYPTTDPLS